MQSNLEDTIEMIKNLPVEDYDKIRKVLDENENKKQAKNGNQEEPNWHIERYKKARKWLDENSEKYTNQWVCLEGDQLIAHGEDEKKVYRTAKEKGVEIPFIHHIVEEPKFYFGGGYELIRD